MGRSSNNHKSSVVPAAVGAGIGGIVVGLLAGAFGIFAFRRRRGSRSRNQHREDLMRDGQLSSGNSQQSPELPVTRGTMNVAGGGGLEYIVEPFAMPSSPPSDSNDPLLSGGNVTSPTTTSRGDALSTSGSSEPADRRTARNVYVVHHDGGRAPVTVYTDEGAEVVELPPRYPAGSTSSPSEARSASSRETNVNRRREPGEAPQKTRDP